MEARIWRRKGGVQVDKDVGEAEEKRSSRRRLVEEEEGERVQKYKEEN